MRFKAGKRVDYGKHNRTAVVVGRRRKKNGESFEKQLADFERRFYRRGAK